MSNSINKVIESVIMANRLEEIKDLKKLVGYRNYYRIKVKNYRIGIEFANNIARFLVILHRKDIYKKFP